MSIRKEFEYIPKLFFLLTMFGLEKEDLTDGCEHILIEGGRSSGKSESVACALVLIARNKSIRILCTREIQKSIKDSSYHLIVKWIYKLGLRSEFHITDVSIKHKKTKTDFIFLGMKAAIQYDSLKSLDDVSLVWYEEAAKATLKSLQVLSPTIRTEYRRIIYTMNPEGNRDCVPIFLKGKKKKMSVHINYMENPFCPTSIVEEADELKKFNFQEYCYIWLGHRKPEDTSRVVLPYSWLVQCVDLHEKIKHDEGEAWKIRDYKSYGGFDIADGMLEIHDKNALALRRGPVVWHVEEWRIDDVYQSVAHINLRHKILGFSTIYYDAVAIGTAAKSEFARLNKISKLPYSVYPFKGSSAVMGKDIPFDGQGANTVTNAAFFKNAKSQSWWNLRLRLENSMRLLKGQTISKKDYYLSFDSNIPNIDDIFLELSQAQFDEDNSGKIIIDKAPGIREIEVDGEKKTRKSPNKADAIVYSFANDLIRGLQTHKPQPKQAKVIG